MYLMRKNPSPHQTIHTPFPSTPFTKTFRSSIGSTVSFLQRIFFSTALFSCVFMFPSGLHAETIELTAEKFIELVKQKSPSIQIDRIGPLVQEAIVAENIKQKYNAPLNVTYSQREAISGNNTLNNSLNFGVDWSYTFGPAGTRVNVGTGLSSLQNRWSSL